MAVIADPVAFPLEGGDGVLVDDVLDGSVVVIHLNSFILNLYKKIEILLSSRIAGNSLY